MKNFIQLIAIIAFLWILPGMSKAQNNYPITNGDFESWSNGSGYSVTVIILPLPIYDSYTYPSNWHFPTYPVNQSINYSGINVNVNTNLPLLKVSQESSGVPSGNAALKMESFMLSDIINSTVYSLAASSIDSTLLNMVIPTIISSGDINIDQLFLLMNSVIDNLNDLQQLMSAFDNTDLNNYIEGGIALNNFIPGKLSGQYKYSSATSGDNGGILLLGSKYNTVTQRRELVGGGYTIALTDTTDYSYFEVPYQYLDEIFPDAPHIDADTLTILMISSANNNRQQGSALYLDNLMLWEPDPIPVDTSCSGTYNLNVTDIDTNSANLSWTYTGTPDHWEAEYGVQGFVQGNGIQTSTNTASLSLSALEADTYYDVYVRSVCEDDILGDWAMVSFKTDTLIPPVVIPDDTTGILDITANNILIFPNPAHGQCSLLFDEELPSLIQVFGMDGKLLQSFVPQHRNISLSIPYSGVFLLRCETKKGIILKKIVSF